MILIILKAHVKLELDEIKNNLNSVPDKLDHLEGHSKCLKIIVDGIDESEKEKASESKGKVQKLFSEKLTLDHSKIKLDWAFRTGKQESSQNPRPIPIIFRFLRLKDKMAVLDKTKLLKGTGIYCISLRILPRPSD